ncbi:hypothetical protein PAMC26577_08795 [Caballeronia sordidicola]|uniref:Uncharacterized protein n=1 Tax=Caballeronia sordidicola TaxID=196367 RepID=A0A242N041_CABSO|nr:hypothetical protein PAMC26577_08795 [Caballeronia sordidicola]
MWACAHNLADSDAHVADNGDYFGIRMVWAGGDENQYP